VVGRSNIVGKPQALMLLARDATVTICTSKTRDLAFHTKRADVLVVATGSRLVPEETEGLTGPGWMEKVFTFYDLDGATALAEKLTTFDGGRFVVNVVVEFRTCGRVAGGC